MSSITQVAQIREIFSILKSVIDIPETDLEYDTWVSYSAYTLLVAVILSARSTDKQVNKVTDKLFQHIKTPQNMVEFGLENLLKAVSSIGLYKSKAERIIAMSEMLIERFNSQVPSTREELMTLPGVGRKSADVLLNVIYKQPTIAVDTHVTQFARTMNLTKAMSADKIADDLEKLLPQCLDQETLLIAHHLMVLYNRHVCSRGKKDHVCPIPQYCEKRRACFAKAGLERKGAGQFKVVRNKKKDLVADTLVADALN